MHMYIHTSIVYPQFVSRTARWMAFLPLLSTASTSTRSLPSCSNHSTVFFLLYLAATSSGVSPSQVLTLNTGEVVRIHTVLVWYPCTIWYTYNLTVSATYVRSVCKYWRHELTNWHIASYCILGLRFVLTAWHITSLNMVDTIYWLPEIMFRPCKSLHIRLVKIQMLFLEFSQFTIRLCLCYAQ